MTTTASSAAPPWAPRIWIEGLDLLVELPCNSGPPYIMKFPVTEAGLSKAINILRVRERNNPRGRERVADRLIPSGVKASNETRAAAREVLRRLGLF